MSGLEFIAALVGSLAWPVVVLVVAVLFRHQLAALLARPFSSLKAGPLELVWDSQVAQVEAELGEPAPAAHPESAGHVPADGQLAELARIAPAVALVQAFARVEKVVRNLVANPVRILVAAPLDFVMLGLGLLTGRAAAPAARSRPPCCCRGSFWTFRGRASARGGVSGGSEGGSGGAARWLAGLFAIKR